MLVSNNLLQLKEVLLLEDDRIVKFSLIIASFILLLLFSLLVLRTDKLRMVFAFIIAFIRESRTTRKE